MLPEFVDALGGGVFAIDTGFTRPRFDAAYLIVQDGRAAFVDSGTNFSVPRLLTALDAVGIARDAVDWVIPTHVHLDHAGGVGLLMQSLDNACVLVHERGVRHMVDPRALFEGALAVYGAQEMQRSYGELQPIDANRVRATHEGMVVELAGRPLRFADTPGHARHHHCIWDEHTRGWFTGDTFGLSYREYDTAGGAWITPTTTPVQFEPDSLRQSIDRLVARDPQCMYLTHYSRVRDIPRLASLLHEQINDLVALAEPLRGHPARHRALCEQLRAFYRAQLSRHGVADVEAGVQALALDTELNAQGLEVWLDRVRRG